MDPARKRATYQDILDLPEHIVGEIIDGVLYTSPRPASPHARASSMIGSGLDRIGLHLGRWWPEAA